MDRHQSNLLIEDTLRVEITRNIGISNRSVGIFAGSNPITEWSHKVDCIHDPIMYRLALIKFFYFELRTQDPQFCEAEADTVQNHLDDLQKIPPLDLSRVLFRVTPKVANTFFYENVYYNLLEILLDKTWWYAMEKRITCLNDK